jgi:hypothetical protein
MKEQKSGKPSLPIEQPEKPLRPDSTMQTETQIRAPQGRLSRDVQRKLGETLQAMFHEIVKEGVPDRFAKLLEQIEDKHQAAPARESTVQLTKASELDTTGSQCDPLAEPHLQIRKTGDKGSS